MIEPEYLDESGPPKDNSPFWEEDEVVGAKKTPRTAAGMEPSEAALSTTVATVFVFETVPDVKSAGPTPRIPSTLVNPVD